MLSTSQAWTVRPGCGRVFCDKQARWGLGSAANIREHGWTAAVLAREFRLRFSSAGISGEKAISCLRRGLIGHRGGSRQARDWILGFAIAIIFLNRELNGIK